MRALLDFQSPYEKLCGEQLNRLYSFPEGFQGKQLKALQKTLSCMTLPA